MGFLCLLDGHQQLIVASAGRQQGQSHKRYHQGGGGGDRKRYDKLSAEQGWLDHRLANIMLQAVENALGGLNLSRFYRLKLHSQSGRNSTIPFQTGRAIRADLNMLLKRVFPWRRYLAIMPG
jgi:hypothetical protein